MSEPTEPVRIAVRIPGIWGHPRELAQSMPEGFRLTGEALLLPDQSQVDFGAAPADGKFSRIFESSCRSELTAEEKSKVENYRVNIFLSGPGGTMATAHRMMQAVAAVVRAGGAGVFIDNSALAHSGQTWLKMTEDGGPDALTFAFTTIVRGKADVYTMGMHVLGFRDIVMNREDVERGGFDIVEVIRYVGANEKPIEQDHIIADLEGPRFKVVLEKADETMRGSPFHNPFGVMRLVGLREWVERN